MSIKAVLFDLDGTITEPLLDFDQIRSDIGLDPCCPSVLDAIYGMSAEEQARAMEILLRHESRAAGESTIHPEVQDLLDTLRRRCIRTGILTRNSLESTQTVLRKHNLYFDAVVTREDGPAKPDGFGIRLLCRKFGILPKQALMVGDYLHDILAAKDAGAAAVLFMTHPKAEFFRKEARFCISRLDEIIKIIDNLQDE